MRRSKKSEAAAEHGREIHTEDERNIEEFAEIFLESMKEQFQDAKEPYEAYAQKVQEHFHSDEKAFKRRLVEGYNALLHQISQK